MVKIRGNSYPRVIILTGVTTSGKTQMVKILYEKIPVRIISVDSGLIYRNMNIGTNKPSAEELENFPHSLVDIIDPSEYYSSASFCSDALKIIKTAIYENRIPVLVGGTMFYFYSLLKGLNTLPPLSMEIRNFIKKKIKRNGGVSLHNWLKKIDPSSANKIHPNDSKRLCRALEIFLISGKTLTDLTRSPRNIFPYQTYQFAIKPVDRSILYQRVEKRFYHMLESGLEEEVVQLFARGDLHRDLPAIRCIGYRQMWSYLSGEIDRSEMISDSIRSTKNLLKHQISWLKKWKNIYWLNDNLVLSVNRILQILNM